MNILYLTGQNNLVSLFQYLRNDGNLVIQIHQRIDLQFLESLEIDFVISHGYRHIIGKDIIDYMQDRIVNLHLSYLPWNRGADPNFWSWVDDTPKGVTIHRIDEGVDTGDILAQKEVVFKDEDRWQETLSSSYICLHEELEKLFWQNWKGIKLGEVQGRKQEGKGSFHRVKDIEKYWDCMPDGWLTRIDDLLRNIKKGNKDYIGKSQGTNIYG